MTRFHCKISCDKKNPLLHVCTMCIGIFAFKMTTKIICLQDELPVVLITTLDLETFIKGHHMNKDIWTPKQSEQLNVLMETDNEMDKFPVCANINEKIVRHLKKGTSGRFAKTICYFLRSDAHSSAWAKVTGKRCNLGDGEGMDSQNLYFSYVKNWWKWKKFKFWHLSSLFISSFLGRKFGLSVGISLRRAKKKMVWENECSSYPRFKLTSDFYKEVLGNVQGTAENSSR